MRKNITIHLDSGLSGRIFKKFPYNMLSLIVILFFMLSCSSSVKLTDALKTNAQDTERIRAMSRLDHTVVLAPIILENNASAGGETSSKDGQGSKANQGEKVLNIDPNNFSDKLLEIFQNNNVFKSIEKLSASTVDKKSQIKEGRDKKATLLMNVSVKKARLYRVGKNSSGLGNSIMWLFLGVPSLWGTDIDYGVEIIADVSFLDIASSPDFATSIYSYECSFKVEGGLTYLERSSSIAVVAMPPQFCPDNLDKIETLTLHSAQEQLLIKLAEQTKKEFGK